jgi:RimJ/RimL family protein N-acetyltransferase|tara:strand:+ start:248 stop:745 length:498 start_codon:yes stop_codon:yes gene_type:complete
MNAINEKPEDLMNAMPWVKTSRKIRPQIINFVLESEIQSDCGEINLWSIKKTDTNELIGLIGVDNMTHQGGDLNFGYWVKYSFQKRGIASKVIPEVLKWLSKVHNTKTLEITVNPDNISGLATCKYIIRKMKLDENVFQETILLHHNKKVLYHTYMFPLKNIYWG